MTRREIGRLECLRLLAQAKVGRVVFVHGALPEVVPVSYLVAGETVVFGIHSGAPLPGEIEGSVAAFQVDSFDAERESGWHVRAIGTFRHPVSPDELAVAGALVPRPWTIGEALELVLQLELDVVVGYEVDGVEAIP